MADENSAEVNKAWNDLLELVANAPNCEERLAILENVSHGQYHSLVQLEHDVAHLERVVKERGL